MGGGVISFGLCVLLVCILGTQNAVKADPIPGHRDLCIYMVKHGSHGKSHGSETTTAAPAEEKPKEEKKDKIDLFNNWIRALLDLAKEQDSMKQEEEDKKKKEEEEKKKKEEEEKAKKESESKKDEPRGFQSVSEFWNDYWKILTALYHSF